MASDVTLRFSDETLVENKIQAALETLVSGRTAHWQNPESGASGSVTPLKTWKTDDGVYCRSYRTRIRLASGRSMDEESVACRSEAVWKQA
ncbi:RT0821/Lpp0805 family surface protein [Roseibium salinum]|uniref:RT0821/Lpp0805 family surface protein n=1 Tax=Roseibium salinum TaxID=1604349 RepID=A0ABT3R730_9HYPH|nr:RT0821/Lpp0805 family surface protein [Roseibium sp. DSM 29163]MCX2724865.1 RT0821/Lpp0805 family surface protein [Roseibium sp. DSM 29163]